MTEREVYPWSRTRAATVALEEAHWEVVRDGERPQRRSRFAVTLGILLAGALMVLTAVSLWLAA